MKLSEHIIQFANKFGGHKELMEQLSVDFNLTLERIKTIKANNEDGNCIFFAGSSILHQIEDDMDMTLVCKKDFLERGMFEG